MGFLSWFKKDVIEEDEILYYPTAEEIVYRYNETPLMIVDKRKMKNERRNSLVGK